jgi:aspartate carbamoyltransferase catalytic subunit
MIGDLRIGRTVHSLSTAAGQLDRVHHLHAASLRWSCACRARSSRTCAATAHRGRDQKTMEQSGRARRHRLPDANPGGALSPAKMEANLYRGRYPPEPGDLHPVIASRTRSSCTRCRAIRARGRTSSTDLNEHPNLAIFRQTDNGVLVRMALFALTLDVSDQIEKTSREVNWYTERRF